MQIIEERAFNLLQYILTNDFCTADKAMKKLDCTERQIGYDLAKINNLLANHKFSAIKISKGRIQLSQSQKKDIKELNFSSKGNVIIGNNKVWLIIIMIFCAREALGLNHFIINFKVSRNSVLSDLKKLSKIVKQYHVDLIYSRKLGYHFKGNQKNIRTLILLAISNLTDNYLCMELIKSAVSDVGFAKEYENIYQKITDFIRTYHLSVIPDYLDHTVYFIALLPYHCRSLFYDQVRYQDHLWGDLPLYKAVTTLYKTLESEIPEEELDYLFILFLSMTLGNEIYFEVYQKESEFLGDIAAEMVNRFETITGVAFQNKQMVIENIRMHLQPAYFRLRYGIPVVNPILEQIKKDYDEVFSICRLVLEPFTDFVNDFIPDDEIAYIAIHFLAMLDLPEPLKMQKRAIIVCQNGVASSVMMKNQLTRMFPEILFHETCNLEQFINIPADQYDIVFSTIDHITAGSGKHLFVISPILTADEKLAITEAVYTTVFGIKSEHNITVNSILSIVSEYATIHDGKALTAALNHHLNKKHLSERKGGLPVLKDLITQETIQFAEKVVDWEEAIWLAAKPLLASGTIDDDYVNAMISNVKKNGPYIVVCPGVAIPHASNKKGVHKLGMSFLKLAEEVQVLGRPEKAVKILITLAAIDDKTHLKALAQLSNLLSKSESRQKLVDSNTIDEVLKMLESYS